MAKIADFAKTYESKATRNIAELPEVSTELELEDDEFDFEKDGKTKNVKQKVVEVNGEKYRVPISVIQQLKIMLDDNPNLKRFKVKKTGEGKEGTKYTVIPLA